MKYSSFTALPSQLEWALVGLLAYTVYILPRTSSGPTLMTILCGFIILNGWISSRAGAEFYSDVLLFLDVCIMGIYYLMLDALAGSPKIVVSVFWIYSALLAIGCILWDLYILRIVTQKGDKKRRNRYILYIVVLLIMTGGHVYLAFLTSSESWGSGSIVAVGAGSWIAVLALWHYDKWQETRKSK